MELLWIWIVVVVITQLYAFVKAHCTLQKEKRKRKTHRTLHQKKNFTEQNFKKKFQKRKEKISRDV